MNGNDYATISKIAKKQFDDGRFGSISFTKIDDNTLNVNINTNDGSGFLSCKEYTLDRKDLELLVNFIAMKDLNVKGGDNGEHKKED
jgi:hypothetical protein